MTAFTMVPRAVSNENLRRRRQSPTDDNAPQKLDDCKESTEPHADEAKNIQNKIDSKKSYRKRKTKTWMQWLSYLIHLVAIVVFVAGLILNHQDLHTSVECKMTYSQRQLIPIHVLPHHPKYNLYKFVDQRDPRPHHSNMMKKWLSTLREQNGDDRLATLAYLNETEAQPFCQPTTNTSILYIPGHWGSYMQSRSIGAHGIQLTGARDAQQAKLVVKALSENQWTGETIEKFQYDVYAVDFQEEGAALHAQFLLSQTAFVAQAVHRIQETCPWSTIMLFGHSIGGYVARLTPILYPETRKSITNIITLGSPHRSPVFGWESSIYKLHQQYLARVRQDEEPPVLIAISGGLRDEMIPPVACNADEEDHSISKLAPMIMDPGPNDLKPTLGMDHRCIVWCHNLLSKVRGIIYTLAEEEQWHSSGSIRIQKVKKYLSEKETFDYEEALELHQSTFRDVYGFYKTIAMESAMLYHSEILLGLIVILGSLHFAGIDSLYPTLTRIFPAQLAITFGLSLFTNYQVKKLTILVLVLLANAVFWFLCWILGSALPYLCCNSLRYNLSQQLRKIRMPIFGCFCLLLGLQSIFKLGSWLSRFALSSIGATYLLAVSSVAAISSQRKRGNTVVQLRQRRRQLAFVAALFLISPFLLAGKIIAVLSSSSVSDDGINGLESKFLPTKGFLILAAQLFLPVAIQFVWLDLSFTKSDHTETKITKQYQYALRGLESMRSISMLLAIVAFGPSAIHMGQGYHAGTLLATLSWLDLFLNPFGYENYGLQSKKATKSPRK